MIELRRKKLIDILFLWKLRNDPETYKYFNNNYPVNLISHLMYFFKNFHNQYIIMADNIRVGQIKINDKDELSLSISKEHQNKGYGSEAITMFTPPLQAAISRDNLPSIRVFQKCGFKYSHINGNCIVLVKSPLGQQSK